MAPTDKNGYPIKHGDLLKSYHFRGGPHRRKYYLYHVVKRVGDRLFGIPYADLIRPHDGGTWNVTEESAKDCEIVQNIGTELFDERTA